MRKTKMLTLIATRLAFILAMILSVQVAKAQSFAECVREAVYNIMQNPRSTFVDQGDDYLMQRGLAINAEGYGLCGPTCAANMTQIFLQLEGRPLLPHAASQVENLVQKSFQLGVDGRKGLYVEELRNILASSLREQGIDAEVQSGTLYKILARGQTQSLRSIDKSQISGGNTPGRLSIIGVRGYPGGTPRSYHAQASVNHYMLVVGGSAKRPDELKIIDPNSPITPYVGKLSRCIDPMTGLETYKVSFILAPDYMKDLELVITDYVSATQRSPSTIRQESYYQSTPAINPYSPPPPRPAPAPPTPYRRESTINDPWQNPVIPAGFPPNANAAWVRSLHYDSYSATYLDPRTGQTWTWYQVDQLKQSLGMPR